MCRLAVFVFSLLLCAATTDLTSLAQDLQSASARPIVSTPRPGYPDLARTMRLEGTVKLKVTVAPDGTARSVETVGGHPLLAKAAEQAVYKWTWARAKQESSEVVEVSFHLR